MIGQNPRILKFIKKQLDLCLTNHTRLVRLFVLGYFLLTLLAIISLSPPFMRDNPIALIDHIFMCFSLVSTTGLASVDFGSSYNFLGQIFALLYIQLGGVGFMALGSLIILRSSKKLPDMSNQLLKLEFSIPKRYPVLNFIYGIVGFTLVIEIIGALLLYIGFKEEGIPDPIWNAIFHSISAFCTAGFSLFGDSLTGFKNNPVITYTIFGLSILGSLGFIVFIDGLLWLGKKSHSITLTSKIILFGTFSILIIGFMLVYLSDPTLRAMPFLTGFNLTLFQTMSAMTTVGFNTYEYGNLSQSGMLIIILLMALGASPSGTGGGIKTTTITALYATMNGVIHNRDKISFFNRIIPSDRLNLAVATLFLYVLILILGLWVINISDGHQHSFINLLFESVSALSTAGISTGITADLSSFGKVIICVLMFIGRVSPLAIGLSIIINHHNSTETFIPEEDLAI